MDCDGWRLYSGRSEITNTYIWHVTEHSRCRGVAAAVLQYRDRSRLPYGRSPIGSIRQTKFTSSFVVRKSLAMAVRFGNTSFFPHGDRYDGVPPQMTLIDHHRWSVQAGASIHSHHRIEQQASRKSRANKVEEDAPGHRRCQPPLLLSSARFRRQYRAFGRSCGKPEDTFKHVDYDALALQRHCRIGYYFHQLFLFHSAHFTSSILSTLSPASRRPAALLRHRIAAFFDTPPATSVRPVEFHVIVTSGCCP